MAEAVPFAITETILLKLGSSAFEQLSLIYGVKDEMRKLHSTLTSIRATLLDAEERKKQSRSVQNWIKNLNQVVYDADDVLEELSIKAIRPELKIQVRDFFSSSNQLAFRYKMGNKIRKIRQRLDDIALDMAKFSLTDRFIEAGTQKNDRQQTHSFVWASTVIGREGDRENIVKLLMCSDDQENVSTISIVGMGGLGKTTLAKLVYNDDRVVRNFDLRMWVWVYDEFTLTSLIEKILAVGNESAVENLEMEATRNRVFGRLEMEELQVLLRKKLDGKKYLLVLDDVWNENQEKWLQLKELLLGGAKGSKIMVTTRSQKVATAMTTEHLYCLESLPEAESWTLFKQLALKEGQERENPNLVEIGKNIVKKCQGVPLAIRTLGSMMKSKRDENEWLSIQNSEIWQLAREENDILTILELSYDHLPINVKQCFAYCSLFPKGYELERKNLIQLWMAQDYIHPPGVDENLEDTGSHYFDILLTGSFFQEHKKDDVSSKISYKLHDLMHDLACFVARNKCCIAELHGLNVPEGVRHISFNCRFPTTWTLPSNLLNEKRIRTFLLPFQNQKGYKVSEDDMKTCFRHLRVLDLHNQRIDKVPKVIGELIHLRYLDLSKNPLQFLPSSITRLQNLLTLKLERCYKLREIPKNLKKITKLRHLEIDRCSELTFMPLGLGQLTSLRTLPRFIIGKKSCIGRQGGLKELNALNHLRGELCILHLENLQKATKDPKEANMKDKKYLGTLKLNWCSICRQANDGKDIDMVVLEGLQPHKNLKELQIVGFGGIKFSTWMMNGMHLSLPNLVRVTIERSARCQYLPTFSQLPSLKVLKLYALDELQYISENTFPSSYFPSLEELELYDLPILKDWSKYLLGNGCQTTMTPVEFQQVSADDLLCFPCLTKLTIIDCPKLESMPFCPSLAELAIQNFKGVLLSSLMAADSTLSLAKFYCPTELQLLRISLSEDLTSLPEEQWQNLTSLQHLEISNCNNLEYLPEMMNCLNLKLLVITECEQLMENYNKDTGESKHKIAHIPHVIFQ